MFIVVQHIPAEAYIAPFLRIPPKIMPVWLSGEDSDLDFEYADLVLSFFSCRCVPAATLVR